MLCFDIEMEQCAVSFEQMLSDFSKVLSKKMPGGHNVLGRWEAGSSRSAWNHMLEPAAEQLDA
jgi:hypothetical protein